MPIPLSRTVPARTEVLKSQNFGSHTSRPLLSVVKRSSGESDEKQLREAETKSQKEIRSQKIIKGAVERSNLLRSSEPP